MNRAGASAAGYTIVETMIFLAVSGVMLMSAMLFMSGQQRRNEFSTGIRDIQAQLTDIMNDVSTGFYETTGQFSCYISADSIQIDTGGTAAQGTNDECTFVGRVIQFAPSDTGFGNESAWLYTLVGKRQTGTPGTDVRTIAQAKPAVLYPVDKILRLPYGIRIERVSYNGVETPGHSIAFVSRFAGNTGSGGITGTQDINLIPISTTTFSQDSATTRALIESELAKTPPPFDGS